MRWILLFFLSTTTSYAEEFTLQEAVNFAKNQSSVIHSAEAFDEAATAAAESSRSALYPKLSIEGNYRLQSVVPEVTLGPNKIQLTDYHTYSVGPTISWALWDSGLRRNQMHSLEAVAASKKFQRVLTGSQVELQTKTAYIQASLSAEILSLAKKATELAKTQNKDIQARQKSGSVSHLDGLTSDSEVLNYRLKVSQGEADWQVSLADLSYVIGRKVEASIRLQNMEELFESLKQTPSNEISQSEDHPLVQVQAQLEKSSLAQADAQRANYWPMLNLQLRSSLDYPNGPNFQQIFQNTLAVNLSWSLFEFGLTRNQVESKMAEARAIAQQKQDTLATLERDTQKAQARIQSLLQQVDEAEEIVLKQQELAKLNFSTYQFGKLSFSDVQTANLRLLDAQNRLAALRAQYLVQTFNLQYLAKKE